MSHCRTVLVGLGFVMLVGATDGAANQVDMWSCTGGTFHAPLYEDWEDVCVIGDLDCIETFPFPPYPVADLYIVVDDGSLWNQTRSLADAMGWPTTVQGTGAGGGFFATQIALHYLPIGRFDVVIDENQDALFNVCNDMNGSHPDYILGDGSACAFYVIDTDIEAMIPTAQIKAEALAKGLEWVQNTKGLVYGIRMLDAGLVPSPDHADATAEYLSLEPENEFAFIASIQDEVVSWVTIDGLYGKYKGFGYKMINTLGAALADRWLDLAADPPDSTYMSVVALGPIDYFQGTTGDPLPTFLAPVLSSLSEQAALVAAFMESHERFLGAAEAHDNYYIRIQSEALDAYTDLLIGSLQESNAALMDLRQVVSDMPLGATSFDPESSVVFQNRISADGFYPGEISLMSAGGLTPQEIDSVEADITGWDLHGLEPGTTVDRIDSTMVTNTAMMAFMDSVRAAARSVVDTVGLVRTTHPEAAAGGPYSGEEGASISLDGSQSIDPSSTGLTFAWDLDGDAAFDDGQGPIVSHSWTREGSRLIGLKATNGHGEYDVAYARVSVVSINDGPRFVSVYPESAYQSVVCELIHFDVEAMDPEGDAISYSWSLDDSTVATTSTWPLNPALVDSGTYRVAVEIDDGSPHSPINGFAWRVAVPDCPASAIVEQLGIDGDLHLSIRQLGAGSTGFPVRLALALPRDGEMILDVFDVSGRKVRRLQAGHVTRGTHNVSWDGKDGADRLVASGVYLVRLVLGEEAVSRKITIMHR